MSTRSADYRGRMSNFNLKIIKSLENNRATQYGTRHAYSVQRNRLERTRLWPTHTRTSFVRRVRLVDYSRRRVNCVTVVAILHALRTRGRPNNGRVGIIISVNKTHCRVSVGLIDLIFSRPIITLVNWYGADKTIRYETSSAKRTRLGCGRAWACLRRRRDAMVVYNIVI